MPPPKDAQRRVHQAAANLYAQRKVDTQVSLGRLIRLIADAEGYDGHPDATRMQAEDRVKKSVHRAYPDERNRLAQLWDGVASRAERPSGDPDYIDLPSEALVRLKDELRSRDPFFAAFNVAMAVASAATTTTDRVTALGAAAAALTGLTPAGQSSTAEGERALDAERLSKVAGAWARVFDAAVTGSGDLSPDAAAVAEDAIRGGHAALQAARQGARGWFRRVGDGPRSVSVFAVDPWISSVVVIASLRGIQPTAVVEHTRAWAAEHLGVDPERMKAVDLLSEAAVAFLRMGHRTNAKKTLEAAFETEDLHQTWEQLLDLAITLAAVMFGHGDRAGAADVLSSNVRGWLDSDYPGDPEDGWGASVDFRLYQLLKRVLADPADAIDALRLTWVEDVGEGGYRRQRWVLAAVLVEALVQSGEPAEAAAIARTAPALLERPDGPVDRQLAAHLSEMCTADVPSPAEAVTQRLDALLLDLTRLVLRDPQAIAHSQCDVLEGLAALADASRYRGLIRRKRAA